jgi:ubiquinone/menaquinone biosynthesis C-methylase UbiE
VELETLRSCDLCGRDLIEAVDRRNDIWACRSCGYVFDNPRPTSREVMAFYSKPTQYDSWLEEEHARDLLWRRRLRKMRKARKPGSLLDVGTGIGQFLHHARGSYSTVSGTEVSESAIEVGRRRYAIDIVKGDLEGLDFEGRQFDNITLFHVLEHVPSPKSLLLKCQTLLAPGGILIVAVPNDLLCLRTRIGRLLRRAGLKKADGFGTMGLPRLTLDPYYAATGFRKLRAAAKYLACSLVSTISGVNIYDTIWIVGKKTS